MPVLNVQKNHSARRARAWRLSYDYNNMQTLDQNFAGQTDWWLDEPDAQTHNPTNKYNQTKIHIKKEKNILQNDHLEKKRQISKYILRYQNHIV